MATIHAPCSSDRALHQTALRCPQAPGRLVGQQKPKPEILNSEPYKGYLQGVPSRVLISQGFRSLAQGALAARCTASSSRSCTRAWGICLALLSQCICMYIYIYMCVCIYTHTRTYIYIYIDTYIYVYVYTYMYTYIYIYTHTRTQTYMHTYR